MQLKGIALNSGLPLGALVTKSDADLGKRKFKRRSNEDWNQRR